MKKSLYHLSLILLPAFFLCQPYLSSPASAGDEPSSRYGLSMHGKPKYAPSDAHLSYAVPSAPKGGTLTLSATGTYDSLNPYAIKGNPAKGLHLVYDRLMGRSWDEPFTLYPLIAEKVDVPADRSSITVHINPQARFSNGSAILAEDVIFSFKTLRDHGRPNMRRVYRLVETVKKQDERRVEFRFGEGHDRETVMILAMMPVLSKDWWLGRDFDSSMLEVPPGSGPYTVKTADPGRRIVYKRVEDYWARDLLINKGHHNFDRIVYDYFRDDTVAFEAFKKGRIDLRREYDAGRWARGYDFPAARAGKIVRAEIPHNRPERVNALIFNTRRQPFDDRRVRQALSAVLDFKWMNKNFFHGQYQRTTSFFPNSVLAATSPPSAAELELLEPYRDLLPDAVFGPAWQPFTGKEGAGRRAALRRADRLLQQTGWKVVDGRRQKNGQTLDFEIVLNAPEDEKLVLNYVRTLKRLGVQARPRVLDTAAFRGRLNAYDFDMVLYFWQNSLSPGTEQMVYWSCDAARQQARWNYPGICHPAVDSLAGGIADAHDRQSLVAHARALDRVLTHQNYVIPLYHAGRDFVAYWRPLQRPETTPVYGFVQETWWKGKKNIGGRQEQD